MRSMKDRPAKVLLYSKLSKRVPEKDRISIWMIRRESMALGKMISAKALFIKTKNLSRVLISLSEVIRAHS